jgi:putative Mn2+ efflux pump MntP
MDFWEYVLYIGATLVFVTLAVLVGGHVQHVKQTECEQAGGTWLTHSRQCISKESK